MGRGRWWSCGEGLVEVVDDGLGVGSEVSGCAVDAASFGEGCEVEVFDVEVGGLDDGVFDAVEPPALVFGEGGSGLGLLGEPVGVAVFDGDGVGDEFLFGFEGVAQEGDEVGGGVFVGFGDVFGVEALVGVPDEADRPGAGWGGDPVGEFSELFERDFGVVGLAVEDLDEGDFVLCCLRGTASTR